MSLSGTVKSKSKCTYDWIVSSRELCSVFDLCRLNDIKTQTILFLTNNKFTRRHFLLRLLSVAAECRRRRRALTLAAPLRRRGIGIFCSLRRMESGNPSAMRLKNAEISKLPIELICFSLSASFGVRLPPADLFVETSYAVHRSPFA